MDFWDTKTSFIKDRMDICLSCEEYHKTLKICKACGCFLPLKSRFEISTCPLKKWKIITETQKRNDLK